MHTRCTRHAHAKARCLRTDHGAFVIFNVYAHSTGDDPDGVKLERKLVRSKYAVNTQ